MKSTLPFERQLERIEQRNIDLLGGLAADWSAFAETDDAEPATRSSWPAFCAPPLSLQPCATYRRRAATRGRIAREGGGEHAGGKRESPARSCQPAHPRRTTRPGTRTRIDDSTDVEGIPSAGTRARNRSNRPARGDWISISRPHPSASVAHRDAPLIDERAATRGRTATEGGD